ncbi:hypothetical protein FNV43_RR21273 [Rhamnella rubrinervis]|uniref:Uncharacterized protein n=1 Tax=Rhamnella rubrinervis TaxID=2594499 RepID=A0A8K0E1D6_9ROSA|nr:hypothetical protein FNV43_RR21273 [Rhamnella rubrinervis]
MYWVSGFCLTSIMLSDENEILCLWALSSPLNKFNGNQHSPLVVINTGDATEGSGSLIRKRLLSPLNRMLLQYQFSGDSLDIGGGFNKSGFSGGNDCCNSASCSREWKNSPDDDCGVNSIFLTDGPLLKTKEFPSHHHFVPSFGLHCLRETTKLGPKTGAISIPPKRVVSPPLSLSPLGPKLPERESRRCSENAKLDDNDITLKDMEESLDGTVSGSLSFWNEESFRISSESSQDFDVLEKKV